MKFRRTRLLGAALITMAVSASLAPVSGATASTPAESPIDIVTVSSTPDTRDLAPSYNIATQTVTMEYKSKGSCTARQADEDIHGKANGTATWDKSIQFDGVDYVFQEIHYHATAEHEVSGANRGAEAHLVHKNAAGDYLVLAVHLTDGGATGSEHDKLITSSPPTECGGSANRTGVSLRGLLPTDVDRSWRYVGSLTTPLGGPYLQPVQWVVFKDTMTVQTSTWNALRGIWSGLTNHNSKPHTADTPVITQYP
ncbi:Carbonic anhydrase [Sinosporangium album]|uniref:carbonic anhydrase n=1 Tax=Sinosporangium album TaxID=504805 RepID=A0A1G7W0L5_9ACTN|nr:carbonic anhydrase family protein [Sinosporangium album]SDG65473.1 Carbonic anhydrase [Sinosporangium album]